ncbi:MAG: hypothetical protein ABF969_00590 [Sporolactobacillus sp.]
MIYTETKEYIFSEIGKRIHAKKDELNLTYYQLAGYENKADYDRHQKDSTQDSKEDMQLRYEKYDLSIIKNIAGGKVYPKKNPNLISDSLLSHLMEKLDFHSELELLWGDFENSDLAKDLLGKIFSDVVFGMDENLKEIFDNVLFDYVPYAEYSSYWQMFIVPEELGIKMPKFPKSQYTMAPYFYQIKEDDIIERYPITLTNAVEFLYHKHSTQIKSLFVNFINKEGYSLKKLDKKLTTLISLLTDLLKTFLPNEDSLGLRVRNILISDYKKFGTLIAKNLGGAKRMTLEDSTMKLLVESSLTYIMQLKRVQVVELEVIRGIKFSGR